MSAPLKTNTQKVIDHKHSDVESLLKNLTTAGTARMFLLNGPNREAKSRFVQRLAKQLDRKVRLIDTRHLISRNIETYRQSMDRLFESVQADNFILLFKNADLFSGNYTNFTNSNVRYATPQSRYLLSMLKQTDRWVLLDTEDEVNIDLTLKRYAELQIQFDNRRSFFKRDGGDADYEGEVFVTTSIEESAGSEAI